MAKKKLKKPPLEPVTTPMHALYRERAERAVNALAGDTTVPQERTILSMELIISMCESVIDGCDNDIKARERNDSKRK